MPERLTGQTAYRARRPPHPGWARRSATLCLALGLPPRRTQVAVAALALFFLLIAPAAQAQGDIEQCFVDKTNAERAALGLGQLAVNQDLVAMARRHSQRMAEAGTIFHNTNLAAEGPKGWKLLGENVGLGPSCDSLHRAFMNSEHHRDNIVEPRYNFVGMGVVVNGSSVYITEQFMQAGGSASPPAPTPPAPAPPAPSPKPPPAPRPPPPSPARTSPSAVPSPTPSPSPSPPVPTPAVSSVPPIASPAVPVRQSPGPPGPSPALLAGLIAVVLGGSALAWAVTRRRRR
jgi:uncharacterized protein YkwD